MMAPSGCTIHTCDKGVATNEVELLQSVDDSFIHEHLQTLYFISPFIKPKL